MRRSLLICLCVVLALVAVTVTALAMESRSPQTRAPTGPAQDTARVAVAHLAPFSTTTAVRVELDGLPIPIVFEYGDSYSYLEVTTGTHTVAVYPVGSDTPAISETVELEAKDYTALAVGDNDNQPLDLMLLEDDNSPTGGMVRVRLGHLAPFGATPAATLADVRTQDGTVLLDDVPYGAVATLPLLPPGTYDLKITSADGSVTLIDPMPVTFNADDIVSVFATGDGANQSLGVFALPSGAIGDFLPLTAWVQVAHLAPFEEDPLTAVDVAIDGSTVLPEFAFGDSTEYLPLEAGVDHLIEISPAAGGPVVISTTVNLVHPLHYTVIAVGDGANQPLDLLLLEDDITPLSGAANVRVGHLAPFAPDPGTLVDICLQDSIPVLGLEGVAYGDVSGYLMLAPGTYDLKIAAPGCHAILIDPMPHMFVGGDLLSVFAVGDDDNQPLGIFVLPSDGVGYFLDLAAAVQVAHLAPFAPGPATAVNVSIDATPVLTNFAFADSTGYLPLEAGVDHLIEVFPAAGGPAAVTATVNLTHPLEFTAIAVGGVNAWPLDLVLLEDNNIPPSPEHFKARIGHLAPFAEGSETLADVRLQDGSPVVPNVQYGFVAPHQGLLAMPYDLKITAPGGSPTLIDPFIVTFEEGDILSVFAVGDGTNQPLGVFALPSGQSGFLLPLARYQWLPIVAKDATP